MLADALSPHGGIVMWRAFVYDFRIDTDRAKCAYKEFVPLDGQFESNTFIQVKTDPSISSRGNPSILCSEPCRARP